MKLKTLNKEIEKTVIKNRSLAENDSGNLTHICGYCNQYNLFFGHEKYNNLINEILDLNE